MPGGPALAVCIDGLGWHDDKDYDTVRNAAKALNLDLEQQIAPPKPG